MNSTKPFFPQGASCHIFNQSTLDTLRAGPVFGPRWAGRVTWEKLAPCRWVLPSWMYTVSARSFVLLAQPRVTCATLHASIESCTWKEGIPGADPSEVHVDKQTLFPIAGALTEIGSSLPSSLANLTGNVTPWEPGLTPAEMSSAQDQGGHRLTAQPQADRARHRCGWVQSSTHMTP